MGEGRSMYRVLMGKPEAKSYWGEPGADCSILSIYMDFQELGFMGMDWIELDQDRDRWRALVNAVMNLRVP